MTAEAYSQTFLARDWFRGYWGVFQSAVVSRSKIVGFESALDEVFYLQQEQHSSLFALLTTAGGAPADLVAAIERQGPWSGPRDDCNYEVAWDDMMSSYGAYVDPTLDGPELALVVERAATRGIELMARTFVSEVFVNNPAIDSCAAALREMLAKVAAMLTADTASRRAALAGYDLWRERWLEEACHAGSAEDYVAWLRGQPW